MKNFAPCKSAKNHCTIWGFRCFSKLFPLFLYFNTDILSANVRMEKRKANVKGNGDWHLRNSRFCKKDMRGFLSFTIWACIALVSADSFCFSARVCGEKILNMQWGFLFHELPAILSRNALGVFIADRSVKRSVLVCWLFRRQSKKKERTVVRSFRGLGLWRVVE